MPQSGRSRPRPTPGGTTRGPPLLLRAGRAPGARARACRARSAASMRSISSFTDTYSRCRSANWLSIDRRCAARSSDDLRLALARGAELGPPCLDLVPEALDVPEHLRVLAADALGHVQAIEEVVEVLGAEDDLDGAARVAVDVEGPEALRDVRLRDGQARLRDVEMAPVRLEIRVDLVELDVREVVGLDRVRELGVHLADLGEDRLRLLVLGADRGIRRRRARADEQRRSKCLRDRVRWRKSAVSSVSCRPCLVRPPTRRSWGRPATSRGA